MAVLMLSSIWLASVGLASAHAINTPLQFAAPPVVPKEASNIVRHDFASFSWPSHFFSDYAGNASHPNQFTKDVLDLLASKSGAQPFIRVGGTSTDRVWYNETQAEGIINEYDTNSNTGAIGIASKVSIGPTFFEGFKNFPDTHWSWQINMGRWYGQAGAKENAMEVARLILNNTEGRLESFEIGNEPDIFTLVGHRPEGYTIADYVREWNEYADAASEQVLKGNIHGFDETQFFQGCTYSGLVKNWTVQKALDLGLNQKGHLASISTHHYDGIGESFIRLGKSLMNHTNMLANVSSLKPAIDSAHSIGIPYNLGETNSDASNLNFDQVIGVFGSALWAVDRIFTPMAAGIKRSNFHQGTTFGYSAWVPVARNGREPYIRPPYYAHILAADAIGHDQEVQVLPLAKSIDRLATHAIYASGKLSKYVLVNFDEWNSTTPYPRPSQAVQLQVPTDVKKVKVERLTAPGASADQNIAWAGLSWNHTDGRLAQQGQYTPETVQARKGFVNIDMPSTEAALISLLC